MLTSRVFQAITSLNRLGVSVGWDMSVKLEQMLYGDEVRRTCARNKTSPKKCPLRCFTCTAVA